MMRSRSVALLLFVTLLGETTAFAHQKSVSYSRWTLVDDGAHAQARVRWLDLTSLPSAQGGNAHLTKPMVADYLQKHLVMRAADGEACTPVPGSVTWLPAEPGWLVAEWQVRCPSEPHSLSNQLFANLGNHVHLATVLTPEPRELVLSPTAPSASLAREGANEQNAGFVSYLRLGVEHILSGWDHLAFLFLLIVVAHRLGEVALLVTGFTVGHSITLAAAALGVLVPHARTVEATIAASIILVALENLGVQRLRGGSLAVVALLALFVATAAWGELRAFWGLALFALCYFALVRSFAGPGRLRWVVACLFGLVHGLGFSSVLLEQQLPSAHLLPALFGFNLGVELGQLGVVAVVWPFLAWLRRRNLDEVTVEATSFVGVALGTYALVLRAFG